MMIALGLPGEQQVDTTVSLHCALSFVSTAVRAANYTGKYTFVIFDLRETLRSEAIIRFVVEYSELSSGQCKVSEDLFQ